MSVLLTARAQWFRGETEEGQPRTLDVNGHTVGIAVCRTWLTGAAPDIDTAVPAGVLVCGSWTVCSTCHRPSSLETPMRRRDHRAAIHATPTSAIWAVAGLLAVVLLLLAAVGLVDTLPAPGTPATAPMPAAPPSAPAIQYLVLISPLTPDRRP